MKWLVTGRLSARADAPGPDHPVSEGRRRPAELQDQASDRPKGKLTRGLPPPDNHREALKLIQRSFLKESQGHRVQSQRRQQGGNGERVSADTQPEGPLSSS